MHKLNHLFQVAHTLYCCWLAACLFDFFLKLFTIILLNVHYNSSRILSLYHVLSGFGGMKCFFFVFTLILIRFIEPIFTSLHFIWYTTYVSLNRIEQNINSLYRRQKLLIDFHCNFNLNFISHIHLFNPPFFCLCLFRMSYPLIRFHFMQGFFVCFS